MSYNPEDICFLYLSVFDVIGFGECIYIKLNFASIDTLCYMYSSRSPPSPPSPTYPISHSVSTQNICKFQLFEIHYSSSFLPSTTCSLISLPYSSLLVSFPLFPTRWNCLFHNILLLDCCCACEVIQHCYYDH